MKKNYYLSSLTVILTMAVLFFISCTNKKRPERIAVEKEIISLKNSLPMSTGIDGLIITDIEIRNDIASYTMSVTKATWDLLDISEELISSEKNKARVLNNIDNDALDKLVSADLGLEYTYQIEGGKSLRILLTLDEIKDIRAKVENGELEPYTLLELTQMEFDRMSFPIDLGNGLIWTNGYIKNNGICYTYVLNEDMDGVVFDSENTNLVRQNLLAEMKSNGIFQAHKNEILRENVHFVYQYNYANSKKAVSIEINGDEIFN